MFKQMLTDELEQYAMEKHNKISIVIQINSLQRPQQFLLPYKYNNIVDTMEVQFDDVSADQNNSFAPGIQLSDADKIIDFVQKHIDDSELLIVASDKSKDRANSVIKALADFFDQDIGETEQFRYNRHVYNVIITRLHSRFIGKFELGDYDE